MLSSFTIAIIASIFLFLVNLIQKKQNFLLDKISVKEKHKVLLITRNKIPLSGIFYFLPVIYHQDWKIGNWVDSVKKTLKSLNW